VEIEFILTLMDSGGLCGIGRDIEQHFAEITVLLDPSASTPDIISQQLRSEDFESERQRFQLWAANLGLNQSGDRSLDYRLQDAPSVREFTLDLLRELSDDLSQSTLISSLQPTVIPLADPPKSCRSLSRQATVSSVSQRA
jgi:hypothetical protein